MFCESCAPVVRKLCIRSKAKEKTTTFVRIEFGIALRLVNTNHVVIPSRYIMVWRDITLNAMYSVATLPSKVVRVCNKR